MVCGVHFFHIFIIFLEFYKNIVVLNYLFMNYELNQISRIYNFSCVLYSPILRGWYTKGSRLK